MTRDDLEAEMRRSFSAVVAEALRTRAVPTARMNGAVRMLLLCADEYAGWDASEAAEVRHRMRVLTRAVRLKPCGTYAAWTRHKDHGETPDQACEEAARTWRREYMRARRAA